MVDSNLSHLLSSFSRFMDTLLTLDYTILSNLFTQALRWSVKRVVNFPIRGVTVGDEPAVHVDLFYPNGRWAMVHSWSRVCWHVVTWLRMEKHVLLLTDRNWYYPLCVHLLWTRLMLHRWLHIRRRSTLEFSMCSLLVTRLHQSMAASLTINWNVFAVPDSLKTSSVIAGTPPNYRVI